MTKSEGKLMGQPAHGVFEAARSGEVESVMSALPEAPELAHELARLIEAME